MSSALPVRQFLPSAPRRWTLLRAMRLLGVPVESDDPNRGAPGGRGHEGLHIVRRIHGGQSGTRRGWRPVDERIPGGPDYVYETAHEAYRQAARRHHPDYGGSEADMQAVNAAWDFIERRYRPNRIKDKWR